MELPPNATSASSKANPLNDTASATTPAPSDGSKLTTNSTTPPKSQPRTPLQIRIDQKVLILGDYETGKTTFAKNLLPRMPRYLVWDPTFAFPGGTRTWTEAIQRFSKDGRAIYWPGRGNLPEKMDAFCEFALRQHSAMIFIDEPAMVGNSSALPQSFMDLHRLGHKRGLGLTIATHSVWDLPHVTHQANHVFSYRIGRVVDLNVLKQILGEGGAEWVKNAPKYHFWHRSIDHEGPVKPITPETRHASNQRPPDAGLPTMRPQPPTDTSRATTREGLAPV